MSIPTASVELIAVHRHNVKKKFEEDYDDVILPYSDLLDKVMKSNDIPAEQALRK